MLRLCGYQQSPPGKGKPRFTLLQAPNTDLDSPVRFMISWDTCSMFLTTQKISKFSYGCKTTPSGSTNYLNPIKRSRPHGIRLTLRLHQSKSPTRNRRTKNCVMDLIKCSTSLSGRCQVAISAAVWITASSHQKLLPNRTILSGSHVSVAKPFTSSFTPLTRTVTIQPFRSEVDKIISHYLAAGSVRELNLSESDRAACVSEKLFHPPSSETKFDPSFMPSNIPPTLPHLRFPQQLSRKLFEINPIPTLFGGR